MRDVIEYWSGDGPNGLVIAVKSSMVPPKGSLININGKTWEVKSITYTVDYSNDSAMKHMRANVDLEPPQIS